MPTTMQQVQRCCVCRERKPRAQFSVATAICLECFDREYAFCEECGQILRQHEGPIRRSQYPRTYRYNGQTLCPDCNYRIAGRASDSSWRPEPLDVSVTTYDRIGSKRKFGVEIETAYCDQYRRLHGRTKFGAKTDCTVSGMEFDSPILYGDAGLATIEEFLAFGREHDWYADSDCGCHTHYDMRDESLDQLCSIAYAYRKTQEVWCRLLPRSRREGSYSHRARWNIDEFRGAVDSARRSTRSEPFTEVVSYLSCDRYEMVNLTAYYDHHTFEVRSLEGSVDPETICNWIAVNCRFMDAVKDMSLADIDELFGGTRDECFEALTDLIGDDDLNDWLEGRKDYHS